MNTVVDQLKGYIALPIQATNKAGWIVNFNDNGKWRPIDFNLQEDAWSYFYSKLNELKAKFLGQPLQTQK